MSFGDDTLDPSNFDKCPGCATRDAEIERLRKSIELHRDQHGDDRCWADDMELYATTIGCGEASNEMPPREEFLKNCARFYDRRCQGGDWPSYQQLESSLAAIKAENAALREQAERLQRFTDHKARCRAWSTGLVRDCDCGLADALR